MADPDGQVEGHSRVVNGKVVQVSAYAKKSTTTTAAAKAVRRIPGRPRLAGKPGSYSTGRDIPGVKSHPSAPEPPKQPMKGQFNAPGNR